MALSESGFEDWCWRNGGVTFEEPPVGPGIVYRFPEVGSLDRVVYLPDADGFQVITDGQFYLIRSLHQRAESWIDDDDRLHIHLDAVSSTVPIRDSVDQSVSCRLRSDDVEQSRSECLSIRKMRVSLLTPDSPPITPDFPTPVAVLLLDPLV